MPTDRTFGAAYGYGMRTRRALALVPLAVASLLLTAGPGSARSTEGFSATGYATSLQSTGGFVTENASLGLTDYVSDTAVDRVTGYLLRTEFLSVQDPPNTTGATRTRVCVPSKSSIWVYGKEATWANMALGSTTGARVVVHCAATDGNLHRYAWGVRFKGGKLEVSDRSNCLILTRSLQDQTDFTVTVPTPSVPDTCMVEKAEVNAQQQLVGPQIQYSSGFTANFQAAAPGPPPITP